MFSVLIINYNNGKYLQEAIDSVLAQTYLSWEVVVVDDKLTDDSQRIYDKYAEDDRFHIFYNEENMGCGYTKARCAELANGEICGFLDPDRIEAAITPKTTAIMPVHCYGKPCDTRRIQEIADRYGLKVIYDAAHAFGVEVDGKPILEEGDMSTLSFHATKVFNTVEGGALVCHDEATKRRIDDLKNFGFHGETEVVAPGINSKMDEMRATYGLLNLKQVDAAIEARHQVAIKYREALRNVEGISFFDDMTGVRHNYSYFPIFIDAEKYGMTRDELYFKMKEQNVLGRRYFYPLISTFSTYRGLESARPENLPVATRIAEQVICLPMHHALNEADVEKVISLILG